MKEIRWAIRKYSAVQHLAIIGRGENLATYCNKYWIQDHVRPAWEASPDELPFDPEQWRPCMLCISWLARNGATWAPLIEWMRWQGRAIRPDTARARYLEIA